MSKYSELAKIPVFSIKDVEELTNNTKTAYSFLGRKIKKGEIKKIRQNIYSWVNPTTGQIAASNYQIACAITSSAYISHHSALTYYELANQVYYEIYVSSETRFREFMFEATLFRYVASKLNKGIINAKNTTGVRITNLERTVIDSIKDIEKISGIEEFMSSLEIIHYLNEDKLKLYLDGYNLQFLYQKTGFLLNHYKKELQISDSFIEYCKSKKGKSTRYLLTYDFAESYYNSAWQLIIPKDLFETTKLGEDSFV